MKYRVLLTRTVVEVAEIIVQADCKFNAENAADAAVDADTEWLASGVANWTTKEIEEL